MLFRSKRWDRILREPVREEPPAGEEPELSQVLDSLERSPKDRQEPPERTKKERRRAAVQPEAAPKPEAPPAAEALPVEEAPAPRKGKKAAKAEKRGLDPAPIAEPVPEQDREPSVLEWIYIEIYYIGIQLLRDMHLFRREAGKLRDWLWERAPLWFEEQRRRFLRVCNHISDTTLFPYRELARLTDRKSVV